MSGKGARKGSAALAAGRAAAVVAKAAIARGGDSARSDCLIEIADAEQVLPGANDCTWASKVKVAIQPIMRRFGPVLDVRVPTGENRPIVSIRFANPKAAEAVMVAASQGFLAVGESEVRVCQPLSQEAVWRSFPPARQRPNPTGESKKKKLRPNERFAPPRMPRVEVDEADEAAKNEPPKVEAAEDPQPPPIQPPVLPPEPPRPSPSTPSADASQEDREVAAGEAEVAKAMAALLEQPFSKQKKVLKSIRLQWHPDKNPDQSSIATRVFQFVQAHDHWLAHHGQSAPLVTQSGCLLTWKTAASFPVMSTTEANANAPAEADSPPIVLELKRLDDEMLAVQKEYEKEVQKLKRQFQAQQAPFIEARDKVLSEKEGSEDPVTGTPALKGFWVQALLNHPAFEDEVESYDIPVLEFLRTIEAEDLDKEDAEKGFRLIFHFAENPYFTDSSLSQEYHMHEPNRYNGEVKVKQLKGSSPNWKAEGPVGFWVDAVYWSRSRTLQWEIYHRIRDINDANAVQAWLSGTVTTCADVLKTIRAYHDGVIRPELFHYINQVEKVVATLDDRIAIHQENLHWFAFENRVHQKRKCGLTATLSG
ncbi:Nucleosome assembly protein [Symbiodinium microadriaticum]|uniref:Nucleosome assembly protein n=1 Tax=Symbiodinium microadriaticum TaxID=2951 RepID=A0A1Q9CQ73_SYMMI|nr:Nucleosome assembly protein [Symbiodinium microadriaticum]CAE7777213.1 NRP1 [Symbiodinium sp. KB8]